MTEHIHTFTTVEESEVTLTFKNTMRNDIRSRQMAAKFAGDQHVDANVRSDFCWFVSRISTVAGADWSPVTETATEKQFDQCYYAFSELVDEDGFYDCVRAVNSFKTRTDPEEKPDEQLTQEEQADPN